MSKDETIHFLRTLIWLKKVEHYKTQKILLSQIKNWKKVIKFSDMEIKNMNFVAIYIQFS